MSKAFKPTRSEAARKAAMRRRFLARYQRCTPDDHANGLRWYQDAEAVALSLIEGTELSREQGANVIAALSPRKGWRANKVAAFTMVDAFVNDQDCPSVHTRQACQTAWGILTGELSSLNGPKTNRFGRNILGEEEPVTVDVWITRIALDKWSPHPVKSGQYTEIPAPSGRLYLLIEQALQEAAAIAEIPPRDFQAILWCHVRGAAD